MLLILPDFLFLQRGNQNAPARKIVHDRPILAVGSIMSDIDRQCLPCLSSGSPVSPLLIYTCIFATHLNALDRNSQLLMVGETIEHAVLSTPKRISGLLRLIECEWLWCAPAKL